MLLVFILTIYFLFLQMGKIDPLFQNRFHLNNEGWNITGYKNISATFMPYNLDGLMSHFITGHDDVVNVDYKNKDDRELWFFSKHFPENFSLTNASALKFTMTSFVGDFTNLNNPNSTASAFVKLFNNVSQEYIMFPISNLVEEYDGKIKEFYIPFVYQVWINGVNNAPLVYDEFKMFLKNISDIYILGDWTRGNETIGLDNVIIG